MKKTIVIIIAALFVFALASVSFAAEPKKAASVPAPVVEKKVAPEKVKLAIGEVVAADVRAKTITVKGGKGDIVIAVDEKVLAKVKAGDRVVAKYTEAGGKNTAKAVKIAGIKMAKKTKKQKAEPAPMETK